MKGLAVTLFFNSFPKVCLGIYFLATGMRYQQIGEMHGVSKAMVSQSVRLTVESLVLMRDNYILFPHTQ